MSRIRKDLTVQPFEDNAFMIKKFGVMPAKFQVFVESDNKIYMPRFYGIEHFGQPQYNLLEYEANQICISFEGTLRPLQEEIIETFIPRLKEKGGGIMNLYCACGKTVLAIKCITLLGLKTLVVCHKSFLVDQWIERIRQFAPRARIGIIQQGKVHVDHCDIVIGMLQSICKRAYPVGTFEGFGLTVVDEAHHMAAHVFSQSFSKISSQYMIGLSATLERKDGLQRVFEWHLGKPEYVLQTRTHESDNDIVALVELVPYLEQSPAYSSVSFTIRGNVNYVDLITKLTSSPSRTRVIAREIERLYDKGRHVLVVSERRSHCEAIASLIRDDVKYGYYLGGMSKQQLDDASTKPVLLATYQFTSEGMDRADLNALVLASPKGDVVQTTGRILRHIDKANPPLIVDIVDVNVPQVASRLRQRKLHYTQHRYMVSERDT